MEITSAQKIESLTEQIGILPFFKNSIEGFSIEEHTPEDFWFNDEVDGPWEWKGPIISNFRCVYGKFFNKKAGYISLSHFAKLAVHRRQMYQLAHFTALEQKIYDTIRQHEAIRSDALKELLGFGPKKRCTKSANPIDNLIDISPKNKKKKSDESVDTALVRLQMGTWIVCADFEYLYTKEGKRYGWGKAVYTTPEILYGEDLLSSYAHNDADKVYYEFCKEVSLHTNLLTNVPCTAQDIAKLMGELRGKK